MKRKLLILALVMLLALSTCLALVGCGGSSDGGETGGTEGGETGGENDLVLVNNSKPTFQFVFSNGITAIATEKAESMIKTVNKVLGTDAKKVKETPENETEIEVIIGSPSFRGDEYKIDSHYLGPEGYAVKVIGKKVIVLYGSDNAIAPAIDYVKETVFGITAKTKKLDDVTVTADKLIENKQEFTLKSVTVMGNDINGYVFEYPTSLRDEFKLVQEKLYNNVGIWIPKGNSSATQKAIIIRTIENGGEGTTPEGFRVYVDENANLIVETEFPNRIIAGTSAFLNDTILKSGQKEVSFDTDYVFNKYDARNVYYEDYGAKGNGRTDDFEAIKACHADANKYGNTVNARPGAVYYIGKNDEGTSAIIKTDVNWNGCKFIFDDRGLQQQLTEQNGGVWRPASAGWDVPIFSVEADSIAKGYSGDELPITSLEKGAANIGWAPGYKAMLILYNSNVRHYIRYGLNEDNGQPQHELIIVDENGNVDSTTPVQWDYETITSMTVYRVDDKPITISGGEYDPDNGIDNRTYVEQKYNVSRSFYTYCYRGISITRSNVVLKNIRHEYTDFTPEEEGGSGSPYYGFTSVRLCSNVTISGMEFMCPPTYYLETQKSNNMGSYEIHASEANAVTYKDCTQSNFFEEDGSVIFHGLMGTNFCKNLTFDNMFVCSFDAHCGVYNVTIRNSTAEHLNFIGDGKITMENVVIYADATRTAMNLRYDYGSTWAGDVEINGLEYRYSKDLGYGMVFSIARAQWTNWNFGYTVHCPQNMILNDISTVKFSFGLDADGKRWEKLDEETRNVVSVNLFPNELGTIRADLTDPNAIVDGKLNANPIVPTKTVVINNYKYKDNPLTIVLPSSPTFKDMEVTVDGEKVQ